MEKKYDDIINLPHYVSQKRRRMTRENRAAQFSPFAALTGHGDAVTETARLTENKAELDECEKAVVDMKLRMLLNIAELEPVADILYFEPDSRKQGGAYLNAVGRVLKIDAENRSVVMDSGAVIPVENIRDIKSEFFGRI